MSWNSSAAMWISRQPAAGDTNPRVQQAPSKARYLEGIVADFVGDTGTITCA